MSTFTKKQLAECFDNLLKENPNKKYLSALFVEILSEDTNHLDKFVQANMGIIPDTKYKDGDEVYVHKNGVTDWYWDEEYMIAKKLLMNEHVKAKIIHVNPWSYHPYIVAFSVKNKTEKKEKLQQKSVRADHIQQEEFPEADDLPF